MQEYRLTCNRCGKVWYIDKARIDELINKDKWDRRLGIANAVFGLFGRPDNKAAADYFIEERRRNELMSHYFGSCPNCRSENVSAELVTETDRPPAQRTIEAAPSWTPGRPHASAPHVIAGAERGNWRPAPGYSWVDPDSSSNWSVQWVPGREHPEQEHIVSSDEEGSWRPAPGYSWEDLDSDDMTVTWEAGRTNPYYPHITSSDKEGYWTADPGYEFLTEDDLYVTWVSGKSHPNYPHITSDTEEGYWVADEGYRFVDKRSLRVVSIHE